MGDNTDSKQVFSVQEAAIKFLGFLIFLRVLLPHLEALCITFRDRPWEAARPTVVDGHSEEVSNAA